MSARVAIITGGGGGLGSAAARALARAGTVIIATGRSLEPLERLRNSLADVCEVALLQQDITAENAPYEAVDLAVRRFGRLDILVNNAGPGYPKPLADTSDETLDLFLDAHLRAPIRFSREALKVMARGGSIINVSSCLALRGRAGVGVYAVAKAGLIGLTQQVAVEHGPAGIRCNAIAPGVVATAMSAGKAGNLHFERTMLETVPLPVSNAQPQDIGAAIAYLCSDQAGFINGHVLVVDGGWSTTHYIRNSHAADRDGHA